MTITAVRVATEGDMAAILEIYNEAVQNSTATFDIEPRSMEAQQRWFVETSRHPHVVLVAECEGDVLAWGCLHPFGSKPGYRFTTENSVYVGSGARGQGIGKAVLAALVETALANGFHSIIARITEDNPVSLRLHERFGFRVTGTELEVGYKFGRWLNVVVMQKVLAADAGEPGPRARIAP